MQIYTSTVRTGRHLEALSGVCDPLAVRYLDIETTGLSAEKNRIYLVGSAKVLPDGSVRLTQWFDDTGRDERQVLESFLADAAGAKALIHYNGNRFDIPFLVRRIQALGVKTGDGADGAALLAGMKSEDLYRKIKPYKKIFGLSSYRQQDLEAFFGSDRTDDTSGGDLVSVYLRYIGKGLTLEEKTASFYTRDSVLHLGDPALARESASILPPKESLRDTLLAHNRADVEGLVFLTPLLDLPELFAAPLAVYKAQANRYKAFDGTSREELLLFARAKDVPEDLIPRQLVASRDSCFVTVKGNALTIKVPLVQEELKYFYANWRDYYYFPEEDEALHKSIAGFADGTHRVQATAKTCYTRKTSTFLPEWDRFQGPFFRRNYEDNFAFFEFTDAMKKDRGFFCRYASYLLSHILEQPFQPEAAE